MEWNAKAEDIISCKSLQIIYWGRQPSNEGLNICFRCRYQLYSPVQKRCSLWYRQGCGPWAIHAIKSHPLAALISNLLAFGAMCMSQTYRKVVGLPFQSWKSAYVSQTSLSCSCRPTTGYVWFMPFPLHSLICLGLKHFNSAKVTVQLPLQNWEWFSGGNRSESLPPFKNTKCPN